MTIHLYGGALSPRTQAKANKQLLMRGVHEMVAEMFGQAKPMTMNSTKTMIFRRYEALPNTPKVLSEGVTPASSNLTKTDVSATLDQYGDWVEISDVVADMHEDPVLQEAIDILGEQAPQMIERTRLNVMKAGTNVFYANGASRSAVNTKMTRALQRRITRSLKRQLAKKITRKVSASPNYGTDAVAPSFIAIAHSDCESDIRDMEGFVPTERYGSGTSPYPTEIGKVEDVRYLCSTLLDPWVDAGATAGTMLSTTGTSADVYPILFLGTNAYGIIPFKGKHAVQTIVRNPAAGPGDELAQRGSAGWKAMTTTVILNDAWMARAEVAVTA